MLHGLPIRGRPVFIRVEVVAKVGNPLHGGYVATGWRNFVA
jgi:hypothetical protein